MKTIDMTIRELAAILQKKVDVQVKDFMQHYDTLKEINNQIEAIEKQMIVIIRELEPIESLIYNQNPQLEKIFESLKRVYGKDDNADNRKID